MAIDDDAGTNLEETQAVKPALMAELTWAKLYTKSMHKDLSAISTAIRKSEPTTGGPEMKQSAEKLHDVAERESHCRRTQRPCWH